MNNFYEYWVNFESWRDFSLQGEHDVEDAHDRYEKRWMIKENDRKSKVCAWSVSSTWKGFSSCAMRPVSIPSLPWWFVAEAAEEGLCRTLYSQELGFGTQQLCESFFAGLVVVEQQYRQT